MNYDSEYTPAVAIPLYQGAKDDVVMFQSILGTAIIQALLPSMRDDGMLVVPGISTQDFVSDPNIVPFGPIYPTYSAAGVDYA
ncbi:hypothetical protein DC31_15965 [Microbacterium sp. CH12i]|uniref:hypothetical protein n=1 Tax=Microbacterium sp. CH12i TaxID=1479651 RepID=UPI000461E0EA|nr:hypothetical protein [Microbacterium sp. CH12i]KDA05456.1 hypothetical protein DC31_15965 [Microbacterium sp. CH12i]